MTTDTERKPIEITGRPRYADAGTKTKITVRDRNRDDLFIVNGGYIEKMSRDSSEFTIAAKHENGTDFEHDSAYVFMLEGAGLSFEHMMGTTLYFSGVIMKGSWYDPDTKLEPGAKSPHSQDTDEMYLCEDTEYYHPADAEWRPGHLIMPFTPPKRKFQAFIAEIVIEIDGGGDGE